MTDKVTKNKLFAIADTHLSFTSDKPMGVFGVAWLDHAERMAALWREDVSEDDMVIVAGDISWAMKPDEALPDLEFLHNLPGKKLLVRGNHDLWWQGITKLNSLYDDMRFLQNEHTFFDESEGVAVCGSRGWGLPGLEDYGADDEKILARELIRLGLSLDKAVAAGAREIICALHFPPALTPSNTSPFTELIERYPVSQVVYGHLHGTQAFRKGIMGEHRGVRYTLVSTDYLGHRPAQITPT
ncbi:MAG: metallophosphoesterase [Clostridiales bacterium]|nr:metallophosphoesterase [Clostridiales bacterium]